jgi:acetate kinase
MNILVLNCGSSTLKFQLIGTAVQSGPGNADRKLARGLVDRIGGESTCSFTAGGAKPHETTGVIPNHEEAVGRVIDWLGATPELPDFEAVGHRVVHGGDAFASTVLIDDHVIEVLESLSELAPLHNPGSLSGIHAVRKILGPSLPMAAVFDTSFHRTIPDRAAFYAIPYELSLKHRVRRYGFHGLAHQYSVLRYAELTGTPENQTTIITLHLGNGCSACAVYAGESVDTSMGFTPLEGLVMGTRSGDVDPALVEYLARKEGVAASEVENWLNTRSGLLGVSGLSHDMRELIAHCDKNPRARLALDVFCYRARKYLGAYLAGLGGAQAVIFSGGIGENSPLVREKICARMEWCGLKLDAGKNAAAINREGSISTDGSALPAFVVHTDEEMIIARETARLIERNQKGN